MFPEKVIVHLRWNIILSTLMDEWRGQNNHIVISITQKTFFNIKTDLIITDFDHIVTIFYKHSSVKHWKTKTLTLTVLG